MALCHMKTCTFVDGNYETRSSSLVMKLRNAELYVKGATIIYGLEPLAARLPELVSKSERLDCSPLLALIRSTTGTRENVRASIQQITLSRFTLLR